MGGRSHVNQFLGPEPPAADRATSNHAPGSPVQLGDNLGSYPKIKYIAAYRSQPASAITHYAAVSSIEPYGEEGKYKLNFAESANEIT